MGSIEFPRGLAFGNPYCEQYQNISGREIRKKKSLDPLSLILTVMQLAAGDRGADHAIAATFDHYEDGPHRSSLSKARKKISCDFFRDALENISQFLETHRPTYGGLGLYAIDGHHLTLPCTKDLREKQYVGRYLDDDRETYTLRAYVGHCCNVLSRTTTSVTISPRLNEHRDRPILMDSVPDHSLIIYDRLYLSKDLVNDHLGRHKVYYLARCRTNSSSEINEFFANHDSLHKTVTIWETRINLIKVIHPKTKEISVFATNLPVNWHNPDTIDNLYKMRWEAEIFQKEYMETAHGEVWHSKSENGILQEFYAKLWLMNMTRTLMYLAGEKIKGVEEKIYSKANFSLCFRELVRKLRQFLENPTALIIRFIKLIRKTREKRQKNSRSYQREIRGPQSKYSYNNTVPSSTRASPPKG